MNWYLLLVFVHVSSAISMFAAWGAEAVLLQRLRGTATIHEARTSANQLRKYGRVAPAAMLAVLATGVTMMAQWGHQPWMSAAFAAAMVIGAIGGITGRRMGRRLSAALAGEGTGRPTALVAAAAEPLATALQVRVAIGIGIVGLMTMKPGAAGSLLILGIAAAAGLTLAARESWRRSSRQGRSAASQEGRSAETALRAR